MKLNIKYNLKVRRADGTIKTELQTPGNTFAVSDTDGISQSVIGPDVDCLNIVEVTNTRGIVVGLGTDVVGISDVQLDSLVAPGTGTDEMTHGTQTYVEPTVTVKTAQFSILRSFTNGSGSTITLGEVGLLGDGSDTSHDFLMVREVLPETLDVDDSEVVDVVAVIQITSGEDSDTHDAFVDTFIKTADETVSNSSTLQDDDELAFSVAANENLLIECHFQYESTAVADIKFGITLPSGATASWRESTGLATPLNESQTLAPNNTFNITDAGIHLTFSVQIGSTAGTFTLQWAQNSAEVSNTILKAGSAMLVHRQ